ncbi:MAG: cell division protein FtsQ [Bacteroidales bacterium]
MIRKIIRTLLLSIIPIYLLISFTLFADKSDGEICKEVRITIQDSASMPFLKVKDVEAVLRRNKIAPKGKEMWKIDTYDISSRLEENQIIREAICYKTPEGTLRIDIYQRNPILRVMGINGNYYIDDQGLTMPVSYNFTAHLPVATGYVSKELASGELFRFGLFLEENPFWKNQIEQIDVLSGGEVRLIPKVGDHIILLGDFSNFEKKLDNLMTFYKKGLNKKGWNAYKTINLKYDNQVICSK